MCKLLLIILFSFSTVLFAESPVDRGACNIGGSLSYTRYTYENVNSSSTLFILNPSFSYFVRDRFSAGLSLDYRSQSVGSNNEGSWSLGPVLRYYFGEESIFGFIGAGYKYGYYDDFSSDSFELSGGMDYFVAKNVSIEGSLNYRIENITADEDYYTNYKTKMKSFTFAIGVNVFIF